MHFDQRQWFLLLILFQFDFDIIQALGSGRRIEYDYGIHNIFRFEFSSFLYLHYSAINSIYIN